jgi:predicted MFS family arabinose efflux permease
MRLPGLGGVGLAFAAREYRAYASGNFVSLIGTWVQKVAIGWLAWELTHSGFWLGVVAAADLFPSVVMSPLAGALADRQDKLRLIRATQLVAIAQSVLLAVLTWRGEMTIELLVALALALGLANAVSQPARLALIPNLVDRAALPSAVAINAISFNLARFIGPALAGPVIAWFGTAAAFAVNAASYLALLAALHFISSARGRPEPPAAPRSLLGAALDGYRYALRHEAIGLALLVIAATSVGGRAVVELLPGFADAVFGRGPAGFATMTAMMGLGAVAGGLFMLRQVPPGRLAARVVAFVLVIGLALLALVATAEYWVALPALFVAGLGMVVTGIGIQTLIQISVEPGMRGRVLAIYGMIIRGGPATGALLMGAASEWVGLRAPVAAGAIFCILAWAWARPRARARP